MSCMSDFLEQSALNYIYRGVAWTPAGTLYVMLGTSAWDDTGGTVPEVNGGGYVRAGIVKATGGWSAPGVAGTISNGTALNFGTATAAWGTVTHMALIDQSTGTGNVYMQGTLTASKVVGSGDIFQMAVGAVQVTFA